MKSLSIVVVLLLSSLFCAGTGYANPKEVTNVRHITVGDNMIQISSGLEIGDLIELPNNQVRRDFCIKAAMMAISDQDLIFIFTETGEKKEKIGLCSLRRKN